MHWTGPSAVGRRAVAGALWSTLAGVASRALGLISTVVIAGLVSPADFGEVQNAAVLVLTGSQLASLGVASHIVTFPHGGRAVAFHATFLHLTLGAVALALVWTFADRLGPAFNVPALARFVPALMLAAFLDRVTFMAERPLVRDLGFGVISASRTAGELAYVAVALGSAFAGHGAMAIVHGNLARSLVRLAVLLVASSWREWASPVRLRLATIKMLVRYGVAVSVKALAELGMRRWDNLLAARAFGPAVAGNYVLAYNLADLPGIQVGEQIADVLVPSFARLEPAQRPGALLRAVSIMALVMAPLAVGLGAVGQSVADAFFPRTWALLGPMLTLLPVMLLFRPIGAVYSGFLFAVRGPRPPMLAELLGLGTMIAATVTLGRHHPLAFVWTIGLAFLVRLLLLMWFVERSDGVLLVAGLARITRMLLACVPMVVVVMAVRGALAGHAPLLALAIEVLAGAAAYLIGATLVARAAVRDLVGLLRRALRRPR